MLKPCEYIKTCPSASGWCRNGEESRKTCMTFVQSAIRTLREEIARLTAKLTYAERVRDEATANLEAAQTENKRLMDAFVAVQRKRDAAVSYIKKDCPSCRWNYGAKPHHAWSACFGCKNGSRENWELHVPCAVNAQEVDVEHVYR